MAFVFKPEAMPVKLMDPTAPEAPSVAVDPVDELVPERLLLKLMLDYLVLIFGMSGSNAQEMNELLGKN